jgi:hypothetical protein
MFLFLVFPKNYLVNNVFRPLLEIVRGVGEVRGLFKKTCGLREVTQAGFFYHQNRFEKVTVIVDGANISGLFLSHNSMVELEAATRLMDHVPL